MVALLLSSYSKTVGGGFACDIKAATRNGAEVVLFMDWSIEFK